MERVHIFHCWTGRRIDRRSSAFSARILRDLLRFQGPAEVLSRQRQQFLDRFACRERGLRRRRPPGKASEQFVTVGSQAAACD